MVKTRIYNLDSVIFECDGFVIPGEENFRHIYIGKDSPCNKRTVIEQSTVLDCGVLYNNIYLGETETNEH